MAVGYGEVKRNDLTKPISTIMAEEISKITSAWFDQSFKGYGTEIDIEAIEVLKDATVTVIWSTNRSSGVLIVNI